MRVWGNHSTYIMLGLTILSPASFQAQKEITYFSLHSFRYLLIRMMTIEQVQSAKTLGTVLQIRRGNRDNLGIISHISP